MQNIIKYIDSHYFLYDLSLYKVSSQFGLSEIYLCQFFKEQMGEGFLSYVTRTRMNHASNLIMQSKFTIEEKARKVGYSNADSFRKAFRRIYSTTPTDFKTRFWNNPSAFSPLENTTVLSYKKDLNEENISKRTVSPAPQKKN